MKKCLSLLIALSMLLAMCVLPVSAETEVPAWTNLPEGAKLIFAENFEEGYAEGNLLEAGKTSVEIKRTTDNTKVFKVDYQNAEKQTVSVVAGPENFNTSKVLKVTSSQAKADGYLGKYIYLNNGNNITRTADTQLVVEYDIMVDPNGANFASNDSPLMNFATTNHGRFPFMATSYGNMSFAFRRGVYAEAKDTYPQYKKDWYVAGSIVISKKTSLKYVIEEKDNFDTARYYGNNVLLTATSSKTLQNDWNTGKVVKDFIGTQDGWYPVNGYENTDAAKAYPAKVLESVDYVDFQYLYSKIASGTAGTDVVLYIDNIKVYEVPAINFTGLNKAEGVQLTEGVVVNFDQPFNATKDTFKVSAESADTWIEDAVTEVTLSADKKSAAVKFDVEKLPADTQFKLWIDDEFTSAAGAVFHKDIDGVLPSEEYVKLASFATLVPLKVVEAPASIDGLIPNDPRAVEVEVSAAIKAVEASLDKATLETSYNGSTATIFFANVEEPKSGNVNVKITGADDQVIELVIPATAVSKEIKYIYNDNLDALADVNLITDGSQGTFTNGNFVFNATEGYHNNYVYAAKPLSEVASAEIIDDPKNEQGKVLKFYTNGKGNVSVTYKGDESDITGKVLVLKTKYNFPDTYATNNGNSGAAATLAPSLTSAGTTGTYAPDYRVRSKGALGINSGNWGTNYMEKQWDVVNNEWHEVVTVIDQATEGTLTDPHTSRRYIDGTINYIEARDKGAGETETDNKIMYDVPPQQYGGIWDFSARGVSNTKDGTTKFAANKMYGTYTALGTDTKGDNANTVKEGYVLIDEFRAFFADKFKVTSISANQNAFIPTMHTLKVAFNQPIDQEQADIIELYTADGEKVEGMTATVANGGYAIDFKLPAVETGAYKLSIAPSFHDARSFQGLGSKNKNYEIPVTVAEYVAFTAKVDNAEIVGFTQGKTTKAVVTLSAKTALVDSNAAAAFDVVNAKGEKVEGLVADVADDQMSITLDFTNLPTADYTITSNDKLVDAEGIGLASEAVKITITSRIDKIMLFEEDFDGNGKGTSEYTISENWLDKIPADKNEGNYNDKWKVYNDNAASTTKVSVENTLPAEGTKLSGNFLKVYAPTDANTTYYTNVKGLIPAIDESLEQYKNKVVVMELDLYIASSANGFSPMLPSFDTSVKNPTYVYMKRDTAGLKYEGTWLSKAISDSAAAMHTRWTNYLLKEDGSRNSCTNGTFTTVIDQRNEVDTVKTLFDGVQFVEKSNTLLTDHALYQQDIYEIPLVTNNVKSGDTNGYMNQYYKEKDAGNLQGFIIYGKNQKAASDNEYYVDNIKVYLVDAFEITSIEGASTAFNAAKDIVKFNFTNKVKSLEDATANIKLVDAEGNEVENAMTLSLAEGGYQVVATLNESVIGGNAEYKFVVSPEIQDEFGQPLAHKYEWYDYVSAGGTGWVTTAKGKTAISGFYATEEAAKAAAGTTLTVHQYTWGAAEAGVITDFTANMTTKTDNFDANGYIRDEETMKLVTVIKTAKATSLYAEATQAKVNGTSVSTTLKFTNPEENTLPVWYIVAAYGDYNEMIGCASASLDVAKGSTGDIPVNFTTTSSDIKSIKVYVWDTYKTMVPYQDAEDIK